MSAPSRMSSRSMRRLVAILSLATAIGCDRPADGPAPGTTWDRARDRIFAALDASDLALARRELERARVLVEATDARGGPALPSFAQADLEALTDEAALREALVDGATELARARSHRRPSRDASAGVVGRREALDRRVAASPSERSGLKSADPSIHGISFARVPAGRYSIGTPEKEMPLPRFQDRNWPEEKPTPVTLAEFWISTTEITREVYRELGDDACLSEPDDEWLPAAGMTHQQALVFCVGLKSVDSRYTFSLPTEEQWEVACRAMRPPSEGRQTLGDWDKRRGTASTSWENLLVEYAVVDGREVVGSRAPNPLGLYDMHGNVKEWCVRDPASTLKFGAGSFAPVRGGGNEGLVTSREYLRASARASAATDKPQPAIGFRVVATRAPR